MPRGSFPQKDIMWQKRGSYTLSRRQNYATGSAVHRVRGGLMELAWNETIPMASRSWRTVTPHEFHAT